MSSPYTNSSLLSNLTIYLSIMLIFVYFSIPFIHVVINCNSSCLSTIGRRTNAKTRTMPSTADPNIPLPTGPASAPSAEEPSPRPEPSTADPNIPLPTGSSDLRGAGVKRVVEASDESIKHKVARRDASDEEEEKKE